MTSVITTARSNTAAGMPPTTSLISPLISTATMTTPTYPLDDTYCTHSSLKPTTHSNNNDDTSIVSLPPNKPSFESSETSILDQNNDYTYNPFAQLPSLQDIPTEQCQDMFRWKIQLCSNLYDFNRDSHRYAKESKRQTLLELIEYVNTTQGCLSDTIIREIVAMVLTNIFRSLSSPIQNSLIHVNSEDEEPVLDRAWPHLQVVYEFFLRVIVSNDCDPKIAKRYIDQQLVLKLLELFSSEDPRERDYLKTILHRIYGKIMTLRPFIRKAIQHIFCGFVCERPEQHNGVSELLEILGSIINGFAIPLKEEHKRFLERSLIPLHKARSLGAFHQQLTYCMTQYVQKDKKLADIIVLGLLKFWPITNTQKEIMLLNEIEEILDLIEPLEFQRIMEPLCRQLAICIQSPHFQVAERVLFFWNNEHIVALFNQHKEKLFPTLVSALYKNSKDHWNSMVLGLTYNVSKLLSETDPDLFDGCSDTNLFQETTKTKEEQGNEIKWKQLETIFFKKAHKESLSTSDYTTPSAMFSV